MLPEDYLNTTNYIRRISRGRVCYKVNPVCITGTGIKGYYKAGSWNVLGDSCSTKLDAAIKSENDDRPIIESFTL